MKNKLALCRACIKILFLILSFFSYHLVLSQQKAPVSSPVQTTQKEEEDEDDQEIRVEWERLRTMDPATKRIPEGIQKKELQYVRSMTSGLRREKPFKNLNTSLYAPAGSIAEGFKNRGPYNVGGRTRGLAIDILDDQHILAGGASGGVWSSENQGKSWTRRSSLRSNPIITDIAQDTRNGHEDTWYYCTGEYINGSADIFGNGVFKSTDNGVTWAQLATTIYDNPQVVNLGDYFKYTQNIEVHPATGDIYIASYNGILKSTDGGATFALVLGGVDHVGAFDVHITTTGVLYAALTDKDNSLAEDGIYRSPTGNAGDWSKISPDNFPTSFIRAVIGSAPSNSNVVYFLVAGSASTYTNDIWKYTYKSGNGSGARGTWVNRTDNIPKTGSAGNSPFSSNDGYDMLLKVHPENENTVFIGGTSLYCSTDGFATSENTTKLGGYDYFPHHADQHALVFFNSDPHKALSGNDGGIFLTNDALVSTVNWSSLNNGYLTTQSYAVSIGPNNTIMSGFQDQNTWYTNQNDPQAAWIKIGEGDGCGNAFSKDGVFAYYSSQFNGLNRSQFSQTNKRVNYESIKPEGSCPDYRCNFVTTFTLDPNNDEILYLAGYKTIWRSNRASSTTESEGWTEISNAEADQQISAVGVSTHPANVVYAGSVQGGIFRIEHAHTGNSSGKNISSDKGLPNGNVSCLAVDPRDADRVLAVFSNYNIKSVFLTTDGGNTWNDVSGNLEQNADGTGNGPSVRWLTIVGANAETYLVGTSTGVYSTSTFNGTQTVWTQVAESTIGNAVVDQIQSRDSDGLVVVGSHGNGLFSGNYQVSPPQIKAVKNPMEITVFANAPPTILQTSELFTSTAPVLSPITLSIVGKPEQELVISLVDNGTLMIFYTHNKTGDAVIVVRGTDANSNYITTEIIVHIINAQKGQTITFNPIHSRTYKDPVICLQATSTSGLPITYTSNNAATAAVVGNIVTIGNVGSATITARQAGNNFYTAAAVPQRLEVQQLGQVITFPEISSKPYGTADFSPGAITNSLSAIKYRSNNKGVATIIDGKIHIKKVGTAKITAVAEPPNGNYFQAAIVSQTLTVTKGIQTITFPDLVPKRYGTVDFTIGASINSSSAITYSSGDAAVATIVGGKIHITGVGNTLITASAAANDLYEAAAGIPQILNVSKGTQRISFTTISPKTFGTEDFVPEAKTNSSSAITYSSGNTAVATIVGGKIHITGAGNAVITASAAADVLYEAADIPQTLIVSKATQSISFTAISPKTFGTEDFAPAATNNSSSAITYRSGNANVATIVDGKIHIISAGTSAITASSVSDANYNAATDMTQTLIVLKGVQAITFPTISAKPFGMADFDPKATNNSSSAITYRSGNANVATIVDGKIHIIGVGTSVITASSVGDANYNAATDMIQTLTVSKGVQAITFPTISAKPFGTEDFSPQVATNSSSVITFSSGNAAVATIVNGKIHITGAGSAVITALTATDALYEAASITQLLTVGKGIQTITFKDIPAKLFGNDDFSPEAITNSSSAITYISGNEAVATIVEGKIHITGAGSAVITASAATDALYEAAADVQQTLTVSKAAQTISIEVPSLTVGGDSYIATPVGGASGNPVILTSNSDKVSVSGFTIAPVSAGKAEISATQSGNANYLEAAASVNFCVNPKTPVISKISYNMLSSSEPTGNQWFLDKDPIAEATSQTLLTTQSGNYSVMATIEGCVSLRSEPLVYTGDDSKPEDELTIYPNPTNSQLYVVLGGFDINSEVSISIYSLVGVSLFNKIFMGSKIVPVSTSFLQNGAYIILVVQGDKRKSKLFFKN